MKQNDRTAAEVVAEGPMWQVIGILVLMIVITRFPSALLRGNSVSRGPAASTSSGGECIASSEAVDVVVSDKEPKKWNSIRAEAWFTRS